ncbi:MAG: hypothetical protein UW69_C0040G0003 [Microgenomates group bacterium GW2011_GWA2_44_7]|nr:MAG: hypothetical protein UW69_C0040G0003 [Microgenomates group bacterium GW2011_GWA2_44_7]
MGQEILNEEWMAIIEAGVSQVLENFAPISKAAGDKPISPVDFSPSSLSGGADDRDWGELSEKEKNFIREKVFSKLKFDRTTTQPVVTYTFSAPDGASWSGVANTWVYETGRKDEGMYLHISRFPDGEEEFFIAPREYL